MRLDNILVLKGLFKSRNKSQEAIKNGIVFCDGKQIKKPSFEVSLDTDIKIDGEVLPYVSRAGLKLEKAVTVFNLNFHNKVMLDIGSSTGGFTDCAIQKGVNKVVAVDVGSNVMEETLRCHEKVELYEQTDIRELDLNIANQCQIATIDVSFISVLKILPTLATFENIEEIMCLIKPQFECGKALADKYKGVILDKSVHKEVISNIIYEFKNYGYACIGLDYSPIKGGSGNIEYLAYFKKNKISKLVNIKSVVDKAFLEIK